MIPLRSAIPWAPLLASLAVLPPLLAQEDAADLHRRTISAFNAGKIGEALELATRAIEAEPGRASYHLARGYIRQHRREHREAVADLTRAIELDPASADAWQRRGEERFKLGEFALSVADFEKVLELEPQRRPHHWQLGISYYYAGRYLEGKEIFEAHRPVNPADVENAVWHYLCTAKALGLEAAGRELLPVGQDPRVPMAEILALFSGKGGKEAVLERANREREDVRVLGRRMFYAHLYLGLHHEIHGEEEPALGYLRKAAQAYRENGYMGEVARVHLARKQKPAPVP